MKFINDRRRMQGQGGFTLIELLVVIAILGVLAGVVVFSVNGLSDRGQSSACEIEKRTIKTAAEAYRAENTAGEYPATEGDLTGQFLDDTIDSAHWTITWSATAPPVFIAQGPCV